MSRRERQRRRARHRGGPHRILFLGLGLVVTALAIGAMACVGCIVSVATSGARRSTTSSRSTWAPPLVVYAADGQRLGFIGANELRPPVASTQIPQNVRDATVAVEDRRFYQHTGVDLEGIVRAAIKNVAVGRRGPGRLAP